MLSLVSGAPGMHLVHVEPDDRFQQIDPRRKAATDAAETRSEQPT